MITFKEAVKIAQQDFRLSSTEITSFPILKLLGQETVYWGDNSETKHSEMVKIIDILPSEVGYAARVSIMPEYSIFTLHDGGVSIEQAGYTLNPDEKELVVSYLRTVFRSCVDGPYFLK